MRGMTYQIHENTEKVFHLTLPQKQSGLSEEQIREVAAGRCLSPIGSMHCN